MKLAILVLFGGSVFGQTITVNPNPSSIKPATIAAAVAIESTLKQAIVVTLGPGIYVTPTVALPDDGFCADIQGSGIGVTTIRLSPPVAGSTIPAALLTQTTTATSLSAQGCYLRDLTIDMQNQGIPCWELQRGKGWNLQHLACLNSTNPTEAAGNGNPTKASVFYETDADDLYFQTTAAYGLHLYPGATDSDYSRIRVNGATQAGLKNEGAATRFYGFHPYGSPKYCVEDYGRNAYLVTECDTYTVGAFDNLWIGTTTSLELSTMLVQVGSASWAPDVPVPPVPTTCTIVLPNPVFSNGQFTGVVSLSGCK